ncbi:MAG: penicillin-binding protein 1A [Gammaproteobacteria bacterium]|nr:MAG: penicillin-binding protein 1A [Gammaproteobacteria bacterium]
MSSSSITAKLNFFIFKILLAFIAFILVLSLALPIGFYGMALYLEPTLPSVNQIKTADFEMPLQIYSHDEKLIGSYGNRMSMPVTRAEIPETMIQAFMSAEDAAFYEHTGISVKGLGRAITEAATGDESQTGGSTITMQVAKNYFLSPEKTLNRKLTELFIARKIEQELSKDEIMTLYVNKIYLGEGAYGIKAAARKYYSKTLDTLTLAETAMIAGLPKAPSAYNPVKNPERALNRRNWILKRMQQLGYITSKQYQQAIAEPIGLKLYAEQIDTHMPYLTEMARIKLINKYGPRVINSGWRVRLTIDSHAQKNADKVVKRHLIRYDRLHGWRGALGNVADGKTKLENFRVVAGMHPAKVTKISNSSFQAKLKDGTQITVPWSSMRWAREYISANKVKRFPSRPSQIVKVGDIVRVKPNANNVNNKYWRLVQIPDVEASLVSLDPDTGAVIALVGGFDYYHSKFNRATDGWRQPGSTIKPLVYSAALEKGYTPDTLVSDNKLSIGGWKPKNSDGRYLGKIPLRQGLYLSRNLVSIRVLRSVGISNARQLLDKFGLDQNKLPATLSLALGTGQASPLQMATAYSTFANGGYRIQPYFIEQIYNFDNELLYQANPARACASCFNKTIVDDNATHTDTTKQNNQNSKAKNSKKTESGDNNATTAADRMKVIKVNRQRAEQAPRIISVSTATNMSNILRDVIQIGTAKRARALGRRDIGGKTGTTNNFKDAWFAGYQPTVATVVWMGFDKPSTLGNNGYGGKLALPIWMDFMRRQLNGVPYQWVATKNQSDSKVQKSNRVNLTKEGSKIEYANNQKKNRTDSADPSIPQGIKPFVPPAKENKPSSGVEKPNNKKGNETAAAQVAETETMKPQ